MSAHSSQFERVLIELSRTEFKPLCVRVDGDMTVLSWSGERDRYGYGDLDLGADGSLSLGFLSGTPLDEAFEIDYLQCPGGAIARVHVIPAEGWTDVILLDASEAHQRQQEIQQRAHEIEMLSRRQAKLMTQLAKARDELETKRLEADEASRLKSRFIGRMSHEFRTPLTSVLGYTQILAEDLAGNGESLEHLGSIERSARHLLSLVENLIEQAKLEAGEQSIRIAPIVVQELLDELLDMFTPIAKTKSLAFRLKASPSLPRRIETDGLRLRQIAINLLGNAFKFTERGAVSADVGWEDDGTFLLSVVDTGPGIPAADLEKIFTSFNRGETHNRSGAGLGLAISRQLAEAMGGEVTLDSVVDEGSRFSLRIPACALRDEMPGMSTQIEHSPGRFAGRTVLVADDTEDIRNLLRIFLGKTGCHFLTASDGREAVRVAVEEAPDLILMDMDMPEMDGSAATRRLRELGHVSPIVALTASATMRERDSFIADGFDEVALKPIDRATLLAVVEQLLGDGAGSAPFQRAR